MSGILCLCAFVNFFLKKIVETECLILVVNYVGLAKFIMGLLVIWIYIFLHLTSVVFWTAMVLCTFGFYCDFTIIHCISLPEQ